jgi:hypothetical protein
LLFIFTSLQAQNQQTYTQKFDDFFYHINKDDVTTGILYDRVANFANLDRFSTLSNSIEDKQNAYIFWQGYSELYRAAMYPTPQLRIPCEELEANITKDTNFIEIGIIHHYYHVIDTLIAEQKLYFDKDSILREDTTISASLYQQKETFVITPLVYHLNYGDLLFYVNRDYYFNNTEVSIEKIEIDFQDGLGLRTVDFNTLIEVNYQIEGDYTIHCQVTLSNGQNIDTYSEVSYKNTQRKSGRNYVDYFVGADLLPTDPEDIPYDGRGTGTMRIYYKNSDQKLRNPILIADGFDPGNKRRFEHYLGDSDGKSFWELLYYDNNTKHFGSYLIDVLGYDLVLLDFNGGGDFIQNNAFVCIKAINMLNQMLQEDEGESQIVVVGPSMGGQITRYALTYMEQNPNQITNNGQHNCRLWIAYDSPHQGANISISAQIFMYFFGDLCGLSTAETIWDYTINCPAAKQMLKYQMNGVFDLLPSILNATNELTIPQYPINHYFSTYYQTINDLGYPNSSRILGVSNGNLDGVPNYFGCQEAIELDAVYNIRISKLQLFPNPGSNKCEIFYGMYSRNANEYIAGNRTKLTVHAYSDNNFCSIDGAPGGLYNTFKQIEEAAGVMSSVSDVTLSLPDHCFMPTNSTLDVRDSQGNMVNYCTNLSNIDLVAQGMTPFDSYASTVSDTNSEHVTFNQHIADYLINEIETYIVGKRTITVCDQVQYSLHLPDNISPSITWYCSDNLEIIQGENSDVVTIIPRSTGDGWVYAETTSLTYTPKVAKYPIQVVIPDDNNLPLITTQTVPGTTLDITGEMLLPHSFTVDSAKTLIIRGIVRCIPKTSIYVKPGGKLLLDGGTLTNACENRMWSGIQVVGNREKPQNNSVQGFVELKNGALIENAHTAISTSWNNDNWNYTGGIIKAENTIFRNNKRSLEFLSYSSFHNGKLLENRSSFEKCIFEVNNDNLFDQNDVQYLRQISMWDVNGITFKGCTFVNTCDNFSCQDEKAIYTNNAGFYIEDFCSIPYTVLDCTCPQNFSTRTVFDGFDNAIVVTTTGTPYNIKIDQTDFSNNQNSICIDGHNNYQIIRSKFDLIDRYSKGLFSSNSTGYKVEENEFYSSNGLSSLAQAIFMHNSSRANNVIFRNKFSNLNHGAIVSGVNGSTSSGLELSCNQFINNNNDIFLATEATIRPWQGRPNQGVDNQFTGTNNSSLDVSLTSQQITYFHAPGYSPFNPIFNNNLAIINNATPNTCTSTLCGQIGLTDNHINLEMYDSLYQCFNNLKTIYETENYELILQFMEQNQGFGLYSFEKIEAATQCFNTMVELEKTMTEISQTAIYSLLNDTILDLHTLQTWCEHIYTLPAKYMLVEVLFELGNLDDANVVLASIPSMFNLTNFELDEYNNYVLFHTLKQELVETEEDVQITSLNKPNWYQLTDIQFTRLQSIADAQTGRSSKMAEGVLCFFYDICNNVDYLVDQSIMPRSLRQNNSVQKVKVLAFPNPADQLIELLVENSDLKMNNLFIYDVYGKLLHFLPINSYQTSVNINHLQSGLYLFKIILENNEIIIHKILKK